MAPVLKLLPREKYVFLRNSASSRCKHSRPIQTSNSLSGQEVCCTLAGSFGFHSLRCYDFCSLDCCTADLSSAAAESPVFKVAWRHSTCSCVLMLAPVFFQSLSLTDNTYPLPSAHTPTEAVRNVQAPSAFTCSTSLLYPELLSNPV